MRTLIILKHNHTFTVAHLVSLQDLGVVFRDLLFLYLFLADVVLTRIMLGLLPIVLLHFLEVQGDAFLLIEGVEVDIEAKEGRQEN